MNSGYHNYLKYQFHCAGSFLTALFEAINRADNDNLERLAKGFPGEVEAYKCWTRIGSEEVLRRAGKDDPIVKKIRSGEFRL